MASPATAQGLAASVVFKDRLGRRGVEKWQRRHTQETRHTRYRRFFADYALLECRA